MNEEIRLGRISRQRGITLVEQYDDACSHEYIASFCQFIGLSVDQFWDQVRRNVNRQLFDVAADGTITRKYRVGFGL